MSKLLIWAGALTMIGAFFFPVGVGMVANMDAMQVRGMVHASGVGMLLAGSIGKACDAVCAAMRSTGASD